MERAGDWELGRYEGKPVQKVVAKIFLSLMKVIFIGITR
jgi:hypothetical protein